MLLSERLLILTLASCLVAGCTQNQSERTQSSGDASSDRSKSFYVGGKRASDKNPGTGEAPFATISKAAGILKPGDTCFIRAGIYRETVIPRNSGTSDHPILFTSDGNVNVIISGADKADGRWKAFKGNIFRRKISLPANEHNDKSAGNTSLLANQVFVNGKMMIEARWPNLVSSDDLMNRNDLRKVSKEEWISGEGTTTVVDPEIPDIEGGWTNGIIWNIGWYVPGTFPVTSCSKGQITFPKVMPERHRGGLYYLTGLPGALDTEKEWFYDGNYLYLWAPGGGKPENAEVKMRNYAFDLRGKSFITIRNISIFAATITTDSASSHVELDRLKFDYLSHFVIIPDKNPLHAYDEITGVRLMGPNSIIKNSIISYSAGHGIVLGGEGCVAENNLVHDISYGGTYACAIRPAPGNIRNTIIHNTIYRTGRSGIDQVNSNKEIGYNDISRFGLINTDLGAIYSANGKDLTGSRIHHNWLHDAGNDNTHRFPVGAGIYLDQNAKPVQIDHNVFWNNNKNDIRIEQSFPPYNMVYNNTMASKPADFWFSFHSYKESCPANSINNIYCSAIKPETPGKNEITSGTDPLFRDPDAGGLGYFLKPGSPAIDHGKHIPGVTEGFQGKAPDAGAYEFNGVEWKAGITSSPGPLVSEKE